MNKRVLQDTLISPMLFDPCIDDLIRSLNHISYATLTYADKIAVVCEGKEDLINVILKIEE